MTIEYSIEEASARASVEPHGDWLRVRFGGRRGYADFHARWLRHNCDSARHPLTRERTLCSSELSDRVIVREAAVQGDRLRVTFEPDGHPSEFALDWLDAHAYARDRQAEPAPPSDLALVELHGWNLHHSEFIDSALTRLAVRGAVVVRRAASVTEAAEDETEALIEALGARGMRVVGTHFGRIEDLRTDNTTNDNTDQLGYTDAGIGLHTDQPFLDDPPRYQLLQCIRAAHEGGHNAIADARTAARYLKSTDARAYELLTTVPVRFHRKQQRFERIVNAPILRDDARGFMVRSSYFTVSPYALPFAEMEEWYRAHDRFVRLVRDARHHYAFALQPGDWVLYDNHRMLHARTAFRGPRWVRGVYFNPPPG